MATAAAVASVAPVVASADETFSDVNDKTVPEADMQEAIYALVEMGAISGFKDGTFKPGQSITRGQVAEIMTKALELPIPENADEVNKKYTDTEDFYDKAPYIAAVSDAGIFGGSSGKFDPQGNISRQQMASVIMRYMKELGFDEAEEHSPINLDNVSADHKEGVQFLADYGLTTRVDDYEPYKDVQRVQFATFFKRTLDTIDAMDVKSVQAFDQTVNNKDGVLQFKINESDKPADLEALENLGYKVTFDATAGVFGEDKTTTSETGKLGDLSGVDTFEYQVSIEKDGEEVASSNTATVTVKDFGETVGEITDYTLNNGTVNIQSGKVALGESVKIQDLKGTNLNGEEIEDISGVTYESSDKNKLLVNSEGEITPISSGQATITVSKDDAKLEIPVEIVSESRALDSVTVDKDSLQLSSSQTGKISIEAKDQYGDPVADYDVSGVSAVNEDDLPIATIDGEAVTDAEGKAEVTVKADEDNVGTGTLSFTGKDDKELAKITVTVGAPGDVAERKIEFVDSNADATLDVNPLNDDNTVKVVLNEYDENGYLIGPKDLSQTPKYDVVSTNEDVIKVTEGANNEIDIEAVGEGTAEIQFKEGSIVRHKMSFTVEDSTPEVDGIAFEDGLEITSADPVNLNEILKDENINLSGEGTISKDVTDEGKVRYYIDVEGSEEDIELGTLEAISTDLDGVTFVKEEDTISLTQGEDGFTENGSITLKFVKEGITDPVATKTINVNVDGE